MCKLVVVFIKQEGDDFEDEHLFGGKAIDDAFLTRSHLVHQLFCWDAESFALSDFGGQGEIVFPFHEGIGLIELMPAEAAFHEAIGKKLFPGLLTGQLRDDTIHDKKEKGERF